VSVTHHDRLASNRFEAGTFAPAPRPNTPVAMLAAQTRMELKLLLRNGEQLLLTMFIPITLLIGLTLFCGDLLVRHYAGWRMFPMAAPAGGLLLIGGWLIVALSALTMPRR